MNQKRYTEFSEADRQALEPMMKIGLLATANQEGQPHLTLVSSLQANSPTQMVFGQFTEGLSKSYLRERPQAGFLLMTLDRELWRGQAVFSHTASQGPEFDMFNNTPMFRYNAYFGVHTVYYLNLIAHSGRQALPMGRVVAAAVQTMLAKLFTAKPRQAVFNPWTISLMNKLDNLKFLAFIAADGFPTIVPIIQAQAANSEQLIFAAGPYATDLETIPGGATVAVYGMSLDMETVLMRGQYRGLYRTAGIRCGTVIVDWIYNPMPPKPQQIYPRVSVEPVVAF